MRPGRCRFLLRSLAGLRRRGGFRVAAAMAAAATLPCGCVSAPPAERRLPTLAEMAPAEAIRVPVQPGAAAPAAAASLTRITLPLGVSLEPAWAAVDENVLPPLTRGVWRANGLRCGVIAGDRLGAFLDGLPPVWTDQTFRIGSPDGPVLVRRSPPLVLPVRVDLTVPPWAPRSEELFGHRAALLMDLSPSPGGLSLGFTPLHQKPEPSVLPRTAAEKERGGRLFTELGLRLRVPDGGFAVVGLARDAGGLPTAAELAAAGPDAEADPAAAPVPASPAAPGAGAAVLGPARLDPPPLPAHLGRALFTLPPGRRGEPQVLLLIQP